MKTLVKIMRCFALVLCFILDAAELLWALFLDLLSWIFEHLLYIIAIAAVIAAVVGFFRCGAAYQHHMQQLALRF